MKPKCKTPYCRNTPKKYRKYCTKCRSKKYKKKHPWRYYFNYHKQNAKRRNISWKLTFNQFKEIWLRSGKWEEKKAGKSWEMHRLEEDKGYEPGNIVIIKKSLHIDLTKYEQTKKVEFRYQPIPQPDPSIYGKAPF